MACQKCLDQRRAVLGAVGLTSLQGMVPATVRDLLHRELVAFVPVKGYPLNIPNPGGHRIRHVLDIAIPRSKVGVDVGYQKLSKEQQKIRDAEVARMGWMMFTFTPEYLGENMVEVSAILKKYL